MSNGLIVVAGEALYDLVPSGPDALGAHPGGGPFNTARTLGRLERPVCFLGRISTDRFGERLAALLAEDGVRPDALVRTPEPTTLALVELDAAGSARYRFYERGTSAPGLTGAEAMGAVDGELGFLHVGTLGLVLEPMASALEALAGRWQGRALVMLDPNCRPAILADPDGYRARLARLLAGCDVVKVSEEDLAWLAPGVEPVAAARRLRDVGAQVVLLTRGGEGAVAVMAGRTIEVAAPRVAVVDTIGAGDAFSGGFLAWWSERGLGRDSLADRELVEAATSFACLVAAQTCARAGASPPRRAELPAQPSGEG
jgi:fructokinase